MLSKCIMSATVSISLPPGSQNSPILNYRPSSIEGSSRARTLVVNAYAAETERNKRSQPRGKGRKGNRLTSSERK